jgi:hypothetical protein
MKYARYIVGKKNSSQISDIDHYIITRKILDSVFNILEIFIRQWEIETYLYTWSSTYDLCDLRPAALTTTKKINK